MFIDDHSELNFRGIIIKGCEGNVVRTYLVRECSEEGSRSSRKKIEAVRKTLGHANSWRHYVIHNYCGTALIILEAQSASTTYNGNKYGQETKQCAQWRHTCTGLRPNAQRA
jgi:hypothetical protein